MISLKAVLDGDPPMVRDYYYGKFHFDQITANQDLITSRWRKEAFHVTLLTLT